MASNHTANFGLNQWAATDPVLREDFNEDNQTLGILYGRNGAPDTYGDFTLPEGFTIDDEGKAQMSALFKGLNLSQKGGQKLVDAFTERVTAMKEAELNALAERRKAWRAEIRQRPTFATDRALALKGLNAVVTDPEEIALFKNSWMSDHPALFSMFVKVGKLLGEDSPLPNGGQSPAGGSAVARFPVKM